MSFQKPLGPILPNTRCTRTMNLHYKLICIELNILVSERNALVSRSNNEIDYNILFLYAEFLSIPISQRNWSNPIEMVVQSVMIDPKLCHNFLEIFPILFQFCLFGIIYCNCFLNRCFFFGSPFLSLSCFGFYRADNPSTRRSRVILKAVPRSRWWS